jgi:uncharacterized protein
MTVSSRVQWWTPKARPVRIAALMELFERNFQLLERLVPDLELPFGDAVSRSGGNPALRLNVIERGRYTSAFRLSYEFPDGDGEPQRREPDLSVRVYRDARLAEALSCSRRPPWRAETESDPAVWRFLDDQWGRNLLLHKWLEYLLDSGYGFGLAGRPRPALPAGGS